MCDKGICDMRVQSLDNKKNKRNASKLIEILRKRQPYIPFVQLVCFPYIISITFLYSGINFIQMHK